MMRRWPNVSRAGLVTCLLVAASCGVRIPEERSETQVVQTHTADASEGPGEVGPAPLPGKESPPPSGLPIIGWGVRNHFPIILKPHYVPAATGDDLLAANEPVLGLIVNGEVRAYPTNQLNKHEMLLDAVGGTPVLVTY
jgi:Protein of unknown function (DUF3179)